VPLFRSSGKKSVARHEQIVFYPSYAARRDDGENWTLVVQGSVFDSRISWLRRKPMLAVLRRVLRMDRTAEEYFRTRMRQFLMYGLKGREIHIRIGDRDYPVGESDYMGLFRGEITLPQAEVERLMLPSHSPTGWLPFQAKLPDVDDRQMLGSIQLIEPHGVSIISDVDDTIKHSNVVNRRDLFRNTFTRHFVPVPGMPELYCDCAAAGAAFHFVSGSPWQLYEPLAEFCRAEGYPVGSFHLKRFRIRDSARKLRRSPQKTYKRSAIEPILTAFPHRRFVLIGDSGEQDPEIYGALMRERPQQILGVFIRAVRGEARHAERLQAAFASLDPAHWTTYREPAEIREAVARLVQTDYASP
jgi:hypothetical protein